jgi:hypothetical protein
MPYLLIKDAIINFVIKIIIETFLLLSHPFWQTTRIDGFNNDVKDMQDVLRE